MPIELEIKLKVQDLATVRERLRSAGATPVGNWLENNTFFDISDDALRSSGRGLRLRLRRDMQSGESQIIITFKGPRRPGEFKRREEHEMTVDNMQAAFAILLVLGYEPTLSFEKKRESWTLDGCKIELDELPYLGTYVEIEGPDDNAIMQVREKLGMTDASIVQESYSALVSDHLRHQPGHPRTLGFP